MRRRDFIILVSGGVVAWPLGALAQESSKIWRMGFIAQGYEPFYDALFEGLRDWDTRRAGISPLSAAMQKATRIDSRSLRRRWFD